MEEPVAIEVPGGPRLEGRLAVVEPARGGLVICHPHPLYGGDMDNPVVVRATEVAREAGLAALRLNFRGVGASQGTHDEGRGEQEDVKAALALLASRLPGGRPVGLAGYSFGAWVVACVAAGAAAKPGLVLIAPPIGMFGFDALEGYGEAVLLAAGTRDPYCSVDDLERLAKRLTRPAVEVIEGADHFFFGKLYPLGEAIRGWITRWLAGP